MSDLRTRLGKIQKVEFGYGGYQDAQIGIGFQLGGDGWGVNDFWGEWAKDPDEHCEWTKEDQIRNLGETCLRIRDLMRAAKVYHVAALANKPIEAKFDGNLLKEWRILTEVV